MVPFSPPVLLLPAAKNSGTRLSKLAATLAGLIWHSIDVVDSTTVLEHGTIVDQSEDDSP